ncbi:AMP-binding protein [Streptomyces virginiae]|uniref:AMP-binding protein n=1 Tax=Streptomyces virginiae TaxID=1961 RepID=UPI003421428F
MAFFLLSAGSGAAGRDAAGTAAPPLLVPRTHNDYAYQAGAAAEAVSLTGDDVYLAALPAESDLTLGGPGIVGTLSVGGTVVLAEDPGPEVCIAAVARERVTVTSVVPAVARRWLDALAAAAAPTGLGSLRLVQVVGAPPDRGLTERLASVLGCRPQQLFGMAEGLLTLTRPADPDEAVFATQGRPLSPDDEIRIVDAGGRDVPDGGPGELLARGPYTVRGYYRAPEHNARSFTGDGYFRTGTLARRTRDGHLVVIRNASDGGRFGG